MKEIENNQWIAHYRTDQPHFGLERMVELLALRGNPHLKLKVIHVGGTNGKGSTIAFLKNMLEKMGLRVGVFSSPYLIHYTDQISINGESIPEARLETLMADYQSLLEGEAAANLQGTTEFEIITAIAYDYFASEQVDVAIMEVGMGGLLDSTNVCQPILTGITTIGLDHVALLGDTLEAIAEQKAGIIKQGIPLVTGRIAPEALTVIDRIAEGKDAPRFAYGADYHVSHQESVVTGEVFDYTSVVRQGRFQTGLLGLHQIENAGMAIALLDTFCQEDGRELVSNHLLAQALEETRWPGRLEVVSRTPLMILDGAHNPHAIKALLATLQERFADYRKEILFTCIKTKALEDMLDLLGAMPDTELTLTHFSDSRATDENVLKEAAKSRNLSYQGWQEFLEQKLTDKKEEKKTVRIVTGSLYFLSQVRAYLMERKNEMDTQKIEAAVKMIIEAVGEDANREGLQETPARVARMYQEIFSGLGQTAEEHLSKSFEIIDDNMVVEKDIFFHTMCEHHFLPFYGRAHIAYIPDGRVAGLSKLARTVEVYSKKPQIQERLNIEVADALMDYLGAKGAFVVIEAEHMCMSMRGVRKPGTATLTTVARGLFETDKDLRDQAYRLMGL